MTRYTAHVSGEIWNGSRARTEYHFHSRPTREEVIAKAGDFARVRSIRLTCTTTTVENVRLRRVKPHEHYGDMRTYADGKRHCEYPGCFIVLNP